MLQRVFVDANVFVSRTLRDWTCLLRAGVPAVFQLHTTEDVLAETVATLRERYPERPGGATTQLRKAILSSIDELVEDFDASIPFEGTDQKDRHVHAAAVVSKADILLTEDKGFVESDSTPYEVYNCDDFFVLVDDAVPWLVRDVVIQQNRYWNSQPKRVGLSAALEAAGCPNFAKRVVGHLRVASGVSDRKPRRSR